MFEEVSGHHTVRLPGFRNEMAISDLKKILFRRVFNFIINLINPEYLLK